MIISIDGIQLCLAILFVVGVFCASTILIYSKGYKDGLWHSYDVFLIEKLGEQLPCDCDFCQAMKESDN